MSANKFFGSTSYNNAPNQDVDIDASPTFTNVYCDTPIIDRYEDLNVAPFSANVGLGINPPNIVKLKGNGAGSAGVYTFGFSNVQEQEVFFSVQLPHSWNEGTDIYPHVHFTTPTQTATTITWGLEYSWTNVLDTVSNSTIITNPINTPPAYQHTICSLPTISGASKKISSILNCRLFRQTGGYVGNALLLSVDFHVRLNTIGSASEMNK